MAGAVGAGDLLAAVGDVDADGSDLTRSDRDADPAGGNNMTKGERFRMLYTFSVLVVSDSC